MFLALYVIKSKIMKQIILIFCFLFLKYGFAQYTQIPDTNFEQALIDLGIDNDGLNGQFLTANAIGITTLNVDEKNISDLTGIEAFIDLEQLFAASNNLESIDLSLVPIDLFTLDLFNNNLSEIDLSYVPQIVNLYLGSNNFTSIDASNLSNLFIFHLSNQNITNLNLTNCTNLFSLGCVETSLQYIDLTTCSNLAYLTAHSSQLTSLDLSGNQEIEEIHCYNNPLTSINLPNNPNLEYLGIGDTLLTSLDLTNCPGLIDLRYANMLFTQLDLSNNGNLEVLLGPNSQLTSLDTSQNPSLRNIWLANNNIGGSLNFNNNPLLVDAILDRNVFEEADFSQNPLLEHVAIDDNPNLQFVNMQNGFNEDLIVFVAIDCPALSCVVVDDPLAANDNMYVDPHTTLVGNIEDCDNLSIGENELQNLFSIYPNPVKDVLTIKSDSSHEITFLTIFNLLGEMILSKTENFNQIDLSSLRSGVYFLKVNTDAGIITMKLVKN